MPRRQDATRSLSLLTRTDPVFPRSRVATPTLRDQISAEPRFTQMPELRADAGVRIAGRIGDLVQRTPGAIPHQQEHATELLGEARLVERRIVDRAIEAGRRVEQRWGPHDAASATGFEVTNWLRAGGQEF